MNHDPMSHEPGQPHDDAVEREWALQERALQAERLSLDARGDEALMRYRAVARALRQAPQESLPTDFAKQVAAQARRRGMASMRFELLASLLLLSALLGILIALIVNYGSAWMHSVRALAPSHAWLTPWTPFLAVGIALPVLLDVFARTRKPKPR
jgi:hypothetical protein